nr:MAG TPA: hypothetical protein [Caudoviricetes sp.]
MFGLCISFLKTKVYRLTVLKCYRVNSQRLILTGYY